MSQRRGLSGEDTAFPEATQAAGDRAEAEVQGPLLPVISGPRGLDFSNSGPVVGEKVHGLGSKEENSESVFLFLLAFFFSRTFPQVLTLRLL